MNKVSNKILVIAAFCILSLVALFIYDDRRINDGKLHMVFCDVGQGDGIYIRSPKGTDIVIDGGPDDSILSCISSHMPFWDRTIDLMILTHPHADHYAGLIAISKNYNVLSFVASKTPESVEGYAALAQRLKAKSSSNKFVCQGDKFKLSDGVVMQVLWPRSCELGSGNDYSSDPNDNSVVSLLSYKDFQVLLTGDAGIEIEAQIDKIAGDIDILKVPHHGSKTGFDESFLKIVKPELAIISVGEKNRYGHPGKNIIDLLRNNLIKTLRTDKDGEVDVVSDGKTYKIQNVRN